MPAGDCRLYLVSPPAIEPREFATLLEAALDAGDVAALQLRLKAASDAAILEPPDMRRPSGAGGFGACSLTARRDRARRAGADGVHVGRDDPAVAQARATMGDGCQLGVSCYDSRDRAMEVGEAGADYVAFGSFFPSPTKDTAIRADPDLLSWWSELMELPVVAIGGINASNCAPLVRAGADFLAVVSAVWEHPDGPGAGVRAMNAAIGRARDDA